MTVAPMMKSMLKTADPTIALIPISFVASGDIKLIPEEKSSGADDPAAMNVAPATSSLRLSLSHIFSNEATK
jgi:hypothetical protein